jgi:hypothetical protein
MRHVGRTAGEHECALWNVGQPHLALPRLGLFRRNVLAGRRTG